ncbi:MAG: polyhydroxyalkanoate depolymerase, partial [Eubacterium sp.]
EIGTYGDGDSLPRIDAAGNGIWYQDYGSQLDSPTHVYKGNVSSAVLLYDTENILIRDIEITNAEEYANTEEYSAPHKIDRTGVAAVAKNRGTLHNITLCGLYIHDVNGNVYNKHMNNGGIYMTAFKPDCEEATGIARYNNVTIKDCFVQNVSRWGIAVGYTYCHDKFTGAELEKETFKKYGHENILLINNYVKSAGGDAITPMYALNPIVEHNTADSCAAEMNDRIYRYPENRMGKVAAAIWPWKCKDALFRFNEVADTRLNQDGMAYDADSGDGTVYEYNYSRQNEGGCVMFCLEEAIHNTFKDNISFDDLGGILSPAGNPDAYVAENQFFIRKGVPLIRESMCDGNITLKDNKITVLDNK